jgi:hypothetical protein
VRSVVAIDPGPRESAYVIYDGLSVIEKGKESNEDIVSSLPMMGALYNRLVIEKIACYGMAVGEEVFETVFWSGRFAQVFGPQRVDRITRREVKLSLCNSVKAKDGNVRQALIDRFGAVGTKKAPGLLYGIAGDEWAALGVAVAWWDANHVKELARQ